MLIGDLRRRVLAVAAGPAAVAALVLAGPSAAPASASFADRPYFYLPLSCGVVGHVKTYVGHDPDDKKMDIYQDGTVSGAPILAAAAGLVHEQFAPGGIEINHGGGWFTVYLHMQDHVAPGTRVEAGDVIGHMGSVGTDYPHLHWEQLYNPDSDQDGDNEDIVYPTIQGQGPLHLQTGEPGLTFTSTNCGGNGGGGGGGGTTATYYVDTFADASVYASPTSTTATGTLNQGTSYVYCKAYGRNVGNSTSYNHYWLKTDPDSGPADQWVSAYYLSRWGNDEAKDNNGTVIPDC